MQEISRKNDRPFPKWEREPSGRVGIFGLHPRRRLPGAPFLARTLREKWGQRRFYDFNVWCEQKRIEKLRYIHRNPITRGLVTEPEQRSWSSFRTYAFREIGVRVS
jgi:hypothetical protein